MRSQLILLRKEILHSLCIVWFCEHVNGASVWVNRKASGVLDVRKGRDEKTELLNVIYLMSFPCGKEKVGGYNGGA